MTDEQRATAPAVIASPRMPWFTGGAALLGVLYAARAASYGLGSLQAPGPGAVPFVVGLMMAVTGVAVTAAELRRDAGPTADAGEGEAASRFTVPVTLLVAAVVCAVVVWQSRIIGLLPASGLATAALTWVMRSSVLAAVLTGAGFFAVSYLLFELWLEVPLPPGYL